MSDPIRWNELWEEVREQYALDRQSLHGPAHWERVMDNGLRLASLTGADETVVRLFAIFHDSCRVNEAIDPGHGARGAKLAKKCRDRGLFSIDEDRMRLLVQACEGHTDGTTSPDVTVGTCWDADRLDLGRVGFTPDPKFLSTSPAREPAFLREAVDRSLAGPAASKRAPER